jgi:hypothetical protein
MKTQTRFGFYSTRDPPQITDDSAAHGFARTLDGSSRVALPRATQRKPRD